MKTTDSRAPRVRLSILLSLLIASLLRADNPVLEWNNLMLDAIRADNTGPTLSSRNLAILSLAMFDAVNSIQPDHLPYLITNKPPAGLSAEASATAAARLILQTLYPGLRARATDLFQTWLASTPTNNLTEASLSWGESVARLHLESRTADGSQTEIPYIPDDSPGQWRRTPPFFRPPLTPHWANVQPFAVRKIQEFRASPPPPLNSHRYAVDFNQVKSIGSKLSTTRTAEQSQIAVFWSDFSYTAMPPGHWNEIAITIARERRLTLAECARLLALVGLAQADAGIACWDSKFHYNTWRPITAIQRAAEDDNPATEADANWESHLISPPFPEYTSGHSTFSGAASTAIAAFLGTDLVTFTAGSDSLPGVFRTFNSLSDCADEVGMSRVYGGIHFMFANREGKRIGRRIGSYVADHYLLPTNSVPRLVARQNSSGGWVGNLVGIPGSRHQLEHSTDLKSWSPLGEYECRIGGTPFTIPSTAASAFIRIKPGMSR